MNMIPSEPTTEPEPGVPSHTKRRLSADERVPLGVIPAWLNPNYPPVLMTERVAAAFAALDDVRHALDVWLVEHGPLFDDYEAADEGSPGEYVDKVTGFALLHLEAGEHGFQDFVEANHRSSIRAKLLDEARIRIEARSIRAEVAG